MPIQYPEKDPQTGETRWVDYYSTTEVASILHVSRRWVQHQIHHGHWPHLKVGAWSHMNMDQITEVLDRLKHRPEPGDSEPPFRLVQLQDPEEWEGVG